MKTVFLESNIRVLSMLLLNINNCEHKIEQKKIPTKDKPP